MKKKRIISIISVVLILIMIYSGYEILTILDVYHQEKNIKESFHDFKPSLLNTQTDSKRIKNQGLLDAQKKNPDIIGWLTVEGTNIDYPFVYSKDNNDYLRKDLNGNYAVAGTIFMDYQCQTDFSCFK